ncbi:MAG: hypothetical protein GY714_00005, partial [Desulfobacterales bacterium]|nr:hypothetical protein [Desulfobacterales bacterium]
MSPKESAIGVDHQNLINSFLHDRVHGCLNQSRGSLSMPTTMQMNNFTCVPKHFWSKRVHNHMAMPIADGKLKQKVKRQWNEFSKDTPAKTNPRNKQFLRRIPELRDCGDLIFSNSVDHRFLLDPLNDPLLESRVQRSYPLIKSVIIANKQLETMLDSKPVLDRRCEAIINARVKLKQKHKVLFLFFP